jgi:hypothetical protein
MQQMKYLNYFVNAFGIYILWTFVHYASAYLYIYTCTPGTIIGFLTSPLLVPAIHCQALRWAIYNGGTSITAMWFILGTWLIKFITPINIAN